MFRKHKAIIYIQSISCVYMGPNLFVCGLYMHHRLANIVKYAPPSVGNVKKLMLVSSYILFELIVLPRSLYTSVNQSLHCSITMQTTGSDTTQWLDGLKYHPGKAGEGPAAPPGVLKLIVLWSDVPAAGLAPFRGLCSGTVYGHGAGGTTPGHFLVAHLSVNLWGKEHGWIRCSWKTQHNSKKNTTKINSRGICYFLCSYRSKSCV